MTVILVLQSAGKLSAQTSNILSEPLLLHFDSTTIGQVMDTISELTGYYFTYNSSIINETKNVSYNKGKQPLSSILRYVLNDSTLQYDVVKRQIIIYRPAKVPIKKTWINDTLPRLLKGKVIDKFSLEPLAYTNIGLIGKLKGTTTNGEGIFHIMIGAEDRHDTLNFSFIGYKSEKLPLISMPDSMTLIQLTPDYLSLQEIIIRTSDPQMLLEAALHNIEENYLQNPANYTMFYRESVKKNDKFMIYLESILDVYKTPYREWTLSKDQARILKNRKIFDAGYLDTLTFRLQGGVESSLMLDVVKNLPDFLIEENFHKYTYSLTNIKVYDGSPAYVIDCKLDDAINEPMLEGRVYLDEKNLAIIRVEFSYPKRMYNKLSKNIVTKRSSGVRARPIQIQYITNYRKEGDMFFLSHSLGVLNFKVRQHKKIFTQTFSIQFEIATTNIELHDVRRIKNRDRLKPNEILSVKRTPYDPGFWGDQSYISPEEDIMKAIEKIKSKIDYINR